MYNHPISSKVEGAYTSANQIRTPKEVEVSLNQLENILQEVERKTQVLVESIGYAMSQPKPSQEGVKAVNFSSGLASDIQSKAIRLEIVLATLVDAIDRVEL